MDLDPPTITAKYGASITLPTPVREGYGFNGWFGNAELNGDPITQIKKGSVGHKIVYAKWVENTYAVQLYTNDGTGTYSTHANLPYTGSLTPTAPTRSGYIFKGWALNPDENVIYDKNVVLSVSELVDDRENGSVVALYAVWEADKYTITYDLGAHYASTEHGNPTEYSATQGADIVLKDLTPKDGFQFGGWYTDAEFSQKVTTISPKAQTNYTLYAKWEHPGTFSIAYTSTSNNTATYTVTRTIPTGAVATADTQNVYVRTQNGTAYGGRTSDSGDKYHFTHKQSILYFGPNDTTKTFTVTENDAVLADNILASYQIDGKARTYLVEIYKIENTNTTGGLVGIINTDRKCVTRSMPVNSSYSITENQFNGAQHNFEKAGYVAANNERAWTINYQEEVDYLEGYFPNTIPEEYWNAAGMKYEVRVDVQVNGDSQGGANATMTSDSGNKIWSGTLSPGEFKTYEEYMIRAGQSMTVTVKADPNNSVSLVIPFSFMERETLELSALHVAPIAETAYKQGEEIYLTVVYSRPIHTITGAPTLGLSSALGQYLQSVTYVPAWWALVHGSSLESNTASR